MGFKKGNKSWNTGLTKETDERLKKMGEKRRGIIVSEKTRKNLSDSLKGRIFSEEHRKNMSKSKTGENNPFYGKHHTEEAKMKKSEKLKNREFSEETRKKMSEKQKGIPKSEETRKKIGESHKGIPNPKCSETRKRLFKEGKLKPTNGCFKRGELHPSFNNWSSREPYGEDFSPELRENIRKKYNYRCQECFRHQDELFRNTIVGMRRCKLMIHHIDYNKKNNKEDNLIPLCNSCHQQTNFKREEWTNYFQDKVGELKK